MKSMSTQGFIPIRPVLTLGEIVKDPNFLLELWIFLEHHQLLYTSQLQF